MITITKKYFNGILDFIDGKNPLIFILYLYFTRWIFSGLALFISILIFSEAQMNAASIAPLINISVPFMFLYLVVLYPLIETFFECLLIFWILREVFNYKPKDKNRPWLFIFASSIAMTLLHQHIAAMPATFVTGLFFAYCFGHFSQFGLQRSYWFTFILHASSNATGILFILVKNAYF